MPAAAFDIDTFFNPRSIVFTGVSLKKITLGKIALLNNLKRGWDGALYGIGSEAGEVEGLPVYTSILDLPETPDVCVILTPANTVLHFIKECAEKGTRHVVIETAGFSEYSRGNTSLEEEILATAREHGIRLIGPNCVGASNAATGMMNAFGFFSREEKESDIATISQSGGIGNTIMRILNDNHLFWTKFVSIGNKLDLDETDFTEYFLRDDTIGKIVFYLESFKRGREFFNLAMSSDKPLIIFKSNRSPGSAKIAQSHTTAISTGDDIVEAALKQSAAVRVQDEHEMAVAAKVLHLPPMKGNRIAVLSRSGGHAVITADACAKYAFDMIDFPESFIENLGNIYHTRVINHQNPLDLGEIFDYTIFTKIVEETLKLDEIDGIVFNHMYQSSYEAESSRTFLNSLVDLVKQYGKPIAVSLTTNAEEYLDISKNHPFPIFTTPEEAVKSLRISLDFFERKRERDNRGRVREFDLDRKIISEITEGCISDNRIPLTSEALEICRAAGIEVSDYRVVQDGQTLDPDIRYPVALKLLSKDASHKSDVGGVVLNIQDAEELDGEVKAMKGRAEKAGLALDGFMVQPMAPDGHEFFIGARRDPVFGASIVAGLGGIYIEVFRDRAIRVAPVTGREARSMLRELTSWPIIQGTRGRAALDEEYFVELIQKVSWLIWNEESIQEIDLNPVILHEKGEGGDIVDARIYFR
jgi:acetyltransferase